MIENIFNQNDKSAKLRYFTGKHNLHTGNGKLIRHKKQVSGSNTIITLQLALGIAPLNAITKAAYDGFDIPLANCILHNAGGTPTDAYFTVDNDHPGASWANVRLPDEFAIEGDPDKLVLQVEGRQMADYSSLGAQTGFGYSVNNARVAVDGTKLLTGSTSLIDWGSFAEYKAWCDELITITKDGNPVQVPRFTCMVDFAPPFNLKQFLDRVTQVSCSDWTWAGRKIRFLPAVTRSSAFNFDLANVTRDFAFEAVPRGQRPNGVVVYWRDKNDPLLREGEPIIIKRSALIAADDGIENFFEFNAATCDQAQAERIANYLAKVKCDLTDYALNISGSPKSYIVLPGDTATLSHSTANWTNKRVKVIKKTEREDRQTKDGQEIFDAYRFTFQVEPSNPYSDSDHTPLITRTAPTNLGLLSPPPAISALSLSESVRIQTDGTINIAVVGIITFGNYGSQQRGKVWWRRTGGTFEEWRDVFSRKETNTGQFRIPDLDVGTYEFKVEVYNEIGRKQTAAVAVYSKTCDGKDDPPAPVTAFTLTYAGGQYIGKFTPPNEADILQYNIYDASDVFLFSTFSTQFPYYSSNPNLTLKVEVEDTSGNKSSKVSASNSLTPCAIEKNGVAFLDKYRIGIKNFPLTATHRRIKRSPNADMSGATSTVINLTNTVQTFSAVEEITRTYSPTPATEYVTISHSFDGTNFIAESNILTVVFENELNDGVPILESGTPAVSISEGIWFFSIREPKINNYSAEYVQVRLYTPAKSGTVSGSYSSSATSITLVDASAFPSEGRIKVAPTFETFSYSGKSGNTLTGVVRGIEKTTAAAISNNDFVLLIAVQETLGKTLIFSYPQQADDYYYNYRWQNNFRDNGEDGWSAWSEDSAPAYGYNNATQPPPPTPPPAQDPAPSVGYEDPLDPINNKWYRRKEIPLES